MKRLSAALGRLALGCTLCLGGGSANAVVPGELLSEFPRAQLIIIGTRSCIQFDIYVAQTGPHRNQGLMHIRSMELHEGMLFIYAETRRISMWMKNTLIPLDMLFFDETAQVASIHENATPLSTDVIDSDGPVAGVIELNGGAAESLGIAPGNQIMVFEPRRNWF
jgi:uncharacterized membrane protein (UPF0127 family)